MGFIQNMLRRPLIVVFFVLLSVVGCAKKNFNEAGGMHSSMGDANFSSAASGSTQDFTVNVGDRVFFSLNSSSIEPDAEHVLKRQAEWLLRYPHYFVTVEGHADDRGTREYNLALGQRRSIAVRDYLVSLGVSSQRMKTISYGKERPVAVCDDISCWNQNRRVVLTINSGNGGY
ncbi:MULTISPECIES: peptidoglycan-associated lipoprotein Pal [Bartonella]|uniref:Peptidoglycan-associated protein n=2 Tax=Bartonella TaxID=773 RepID=A0A024LPZ3_9HYPH|nr:MULTISPECIES: peptidoglycan-associated lipoprotein Pal [Bartonella]MBA9082732.1 peptidoglycan-associated lipoprotein [Bartonella chomelii]CDP79421.1 peptidoglycan-associated lipoprotein [Bartonella schoenbuchensis]CDP79450.1 peptidoglycan-associated lipoprotein [Bartonella schoenbuchensis]